MEGEETTTIRLPAEISITYEFRNPFKSEKETPSKLSINVKIFLTKDEAEALNRELLDVMIQALNTIFEAKKLEQDIDTLTEDLKQVLDADPA
jgi:NTP pyrophosphatase (non-canonical NTP hydrolase)